MSEMEEIKQTLAGISQAFKDHRHDPATIDGKALEAAGLEAIKQYQAQQVVRKGEEQTVGPAAVNKGVYVDSKGMIRVVDGRYRDREVKDVALAAGLLSRAHDLWPNKYSEPNKELMQKAMSATGALTGAELLAHAVAPSTWDDVFLESQIVSNLPNKIMNMPSDPYPLPIGLGALTWYKGVSVTATTATNLATAESTLTCTEQIAEVDWEYDLEEDSIMAVRPLIENRIRQSAAEQIDYFVLNADSTDANNINSHDNANQTDTKPFLSKGEDGIRHAFQVGTAAQTVDAAGLALTDAHILSALALMGKYAVNPKDCLMIMDVATYFKGLQDLDGIMTLDKIGNSAVLLTGQVAAYRGIPVVVSASMHLTEADHFVDDADSGTFGMVAIANRNCWTVGFKRGITIEADRDIQKREVIMVVSFRIAVSSWGGATKSAMKHTAGIAHILV